MYAYSKNSTHQNRISNDRRDRIKKILVLMMAAVLLVGCGKDEEIKVPETPVVQKEQSKEALEEVETPVEETSDIEEWEAKNIEGVETEISGVTIRPFRVSPGMSSKYAIALDMSNSNEFDCYVWIVELVVNGYKTDQSESGFLLEANGGRGFLQDLVNLDLDNGGEGVIEEISMQFVVSANELPSEGIYGDPVIVTTEHFREFKK